MELTLTTGTGLHIHAFEQGHIVVIDDKGVKQVFKESVLITPKTVQRWPLKTLDELNEDHVLALLDLKPEMILLGTGEKLIFPAPALLKAIYAQKIGLEVMKTKAACQTYNVLASDNRNVLAALML